MTNMLVPFDLLIDTDFGVIKYYQISVGHTDPLERAIPHMMDMIGPEHNDYLKYCLIHRKFVNPLTMIYKPEKMVVHNPDGLYENIINTKSKMVLPLSMNTAVMDLVCKSLFVPEELHFEVLCRTDEEKDYAYERFRRHFNEDKIPISIIVSKMKDVDISEYGTIYVKNIYDLNEYDKNKLHGKNLIIAKYDFNKEPDIEVDLPRRDVADDLSSTNRILFIDVYSIDENNIEVG